MKRYIAIGTLIAALAGVGIYMLSLGTAERVTQIPPVFSGQEIGWITNNGITLLQTRQGASVYPVIHDDQALYVLSGNADKIKKYYIDKEKKEVVIIQDLVNPKKRGEGYFQLVTVPVKKYQPIINDGKVMVRIQFNYLDDESLYLVYDLQNKSTKLVDASFSPGK